MPIQTEALSKRYGSISALEDCTFAVAPGEIVGLLGPNGAGKSTLLRLLMGYLKPTRGRAEIDGLDCYRQSVEVHRRLSYLPGDARLFRHLTGIQTLKFFSRLHFHGSLERAVELAERLQLNLSRRVGQMSTGMRQKLALVVALAPRVPLAVLDEPTANLDPTVRGEIIQLVREAREAGRAVLFSSHVLSEVEQACDRVIVLRSGRLVDDVQMSQVTLQHRITARLTGPLALPPAELAEGLHMQHQPDGCVVLVTPGELTPLLGWLAQQSLSELRIEPLGLGALYQRHHPASAP